MHALETVLRTHDQVQTECSRRVLVPDPVPGRWKRPRPEHAEGPTQYVKDPLDEKTPSTNSERERHLLLNNHRYAVVVQDLATQWDRMA